jgi:hypothetical protein
MTRLQRSELSGKDTTQMLLKILKECRIVGYVGVVIAALAVSPSLIGRVMAESPHEIDFTQVLTGINGDELKQCNKSEGDPPKCIDLASMTLGDIALYALIVPSEDERNLDPKKKFERDRLARRIYKNAHAMLSPEDVALIKERIGKTSSVVQVGAAWSLLDPTLANK